MCQFDHLGRMNDLPINKSITQSSNQSIVEFNDTPEIKSDFKRKFI